MKFHEIFPDFYRDNETEWYEFIKDVLTPEFDIALEEVNALWNLIDIDTIPEEKLPLLADNLGFEFEKIIPAPFRKQLANAIYLHKFKGSVYAVEKALSFLGLLGYLKEWFLTEGNLPPHTFALLLSKPLENIREILEFISKYKPLSAHLAFITDGNCRSRVNLDRSCQLSRVLLSSLDGVKKDGVRFCFAEKNCLPFGYEKPEDKKALTNIRFQTVFSFNRNRLDVFRLSRLPGRKPFMSNFAHLFTKEFIYATSAKDRYYLISECNITLSGRERLDREGFQGATVVYKEFKLSQSKLDRETRVVKLISCHQKRVYEQIVLNPTYPQSFSVWISKIDRNFVFSPSVSNDLSLSGKPIERRVEINLTELFQAKRTWLGYWKGSWSDSYRSSAISQLTEEQ